MVIVSCSSFLIVSLLTASNFGVSLLTTPEFSTEILTFSMTPLATVSFIFSIGNVCDGSDCWFGCVSI